MMNRDPVAGLSQRQSLTSDHESSFNKEEEVQIDTQREILISDKEIDTEFQQTESMIVTTNLIEENDEERLALELAIKRSLEDQSESNIIESSSDSDGEERLSLEDQPESNSDSDSDGKLNK